MISSAFAVSTGGGGGAVTTGGAGGGGVCRTFQPRKLAKATTASTSTIRPAEGPELSPLLAGLGLRAVLVAAADAVAVRPIAAARARSPVGAGWSAAWARSISARPAVWPRHQRKPSPPLTPTSVVKVAAQPDLPSRAADSARSRSAVSWSAQLSKATSAGPVASTSQAAFAPVPATCRQVAAGVKAGPGLRMRGFASPSSQVGSPDHSSFHWSQR